MPSSVSKNDAHLQGWVMASPASKNNFLEAGQMLQKPHYICGAGYLFTHPLKKDIPTNHFL
jgi:hypothetical protein